jgi:hypothetical protein
VKTAALVVLGVIALAAANVAVIASLHKSDVHEHGLWAAMETAKVSDRADVQAAIPAEVLAQEGRRITMQGVVFQMNAGVEDGQVRWCVLMPPSRFGCCGISCDPRPELSVYVDCSKHPWPAGGAKQRMTTVEGVLRLDRTGGSWCLYTLEDAVVGAADAPSR